MNVRGPFGSRAFALQLGWLVAVLVGLFASAALRAQSGASSGDITFTVEKDIGIQKFKNDPSLTDEEIARIVNWANSGTPRGNPADMPPSLSFDESDKWTIGGPDWWGDVGLIPTGLTEDRYDIGCPLCWAPPVPQAASSAAAQGNQ